MRHISDYLDAAMARNGIPSDAELSRMLGKKRGSCNTYRMGRAWPSDDTMVRLAGLAGVDPAEALLDLNRWRTVGPARRVYEEIAAAVARTAAVILLAFTFYLLNDRPPALAQHSENEVTRGSGELYIMENSWAGTNGGCSSSGVRRVMH